MFNIHISMAFKSWILGLNHDQMRSAVWAIGMLRIDGCLRPDEAQNHGVLYSSVSYSGKPLVRVEVYGIYSISVTNPAVFAYLHLGDDIHVVKFGTLSEVTLLATMKAGVELYNNVKGNA